MNLYNSFFHLLLITFILAMGSNTHFAQKPVVMNGYMGIQGGEIFHYKIELYPQSDQKWEGYSYTYSDQKNTVKASITVELLADSLFKIEEHQLIYNRGFKSKATICLLNATLNISSDKKEITGPILTQTDIQKSLCSGGTLTFIQEQEIRQLFQPLSKKTAAAATTAASSKATPKANPSVTANTKLQQHFQTKAQREEFELQRQKREEERIAAQKPEQKEITEGKAHKIKVNNEIIDFFIWDGGKIDYDQVSVYVNNQKLLGPHTLTASLKKLSIPMEEQQISIKILALNEGNEPPNTADIVIKDGKDIHHILAYNLKGKFAEIILIKNE